MQLSAPASFPETLLPASSGEPVAEGLTEGDLPADFAALFAGLTRSPTPPTPPPGQPALPALPPEAGVSNLRMHLEAAGLAGFAAVAMPVGEEAAAEAASSDLIASEEPAEGDAVAPSMVPVVPAMAAAPVGTPATAVKAGAETGSPGSALLAEGRGERSAAQTAQPGHPTVPAPSHAATPAPAPGATISPATPPSVTPANASADASSPFSADAPAEDAASPAKAASFSAEGGPWTAEARRAAAALTHAVDPALRGLKRGLERLANPAGGEAGRPPANLAAAGARLVSAADGEISASEKNFLNIEGELLTKQEAVLGTGVAFKEPVMTSSAPATASPAVLSVAVASREAGLDLGSAATLDAKVTVPEPVERLAHRAVEAVAATIERSAAQPAQSVNLKFAVQGVDLMVRVALRADEIQVTFRTESEDLRNALAHEWQMVRGRDPEGVLQSVTPVFTAGESGTSTSQHQAGSRDQAATFAQLQAQAEGQHQRQSSRHSASAATPAAPHGSSAGAAGGSAPRVSSPESAGATRLLHTFA